MAVTVEDGSGVANSDSYATRDEYIAYAAAVGTTIADAEAADQELITAARFIDQHEVNLKGYRVARDQSMAWPRNSVIIEGWAWGSDEIPRQLKLCQMAYALDVNAGDDLWNRGANPNLVARKEKVDVIDVEYAVRDGEGQKSTKTSKGDTWLNMLLNRNGLTLVRA